ncbi:MAG: hypothetical protein ACOVO5_08285, partial [Devosia sp.]
MDANPLSSAGLGDIEQLTPPIGSAASSAPCFRLRRNTSLALCGLAKWSHIGIIQREDTSPFDLPANRFSALLQRRFLTRKLLWRNCLDEGLLNLRRSHHEP